MPKARHLSCHFFLSFDLHLRHSLLCFDLHLRRPQCRISLNLRSVHVVMRTNVDADNGNYNCHKGNCQTHIVVPPLMGTL